jgi:predicted nucleotidyltransferase
MDNPAAGCRVEIESEVNPLILVLNMGMIAPIMGTITPDNKASALFGKTRRAILALLFTHPERSYYVREIVQASESGVGAVQRELSRLAQSGLLTRTEVGNQVHYQANPDSPIFEEMRSLMVKTAGMADVLREAIRPLEEGIAFAFIYGSQASGEAGPSSDVDLMVVGEVDDLALHRVVSEAESRLGRTINYSLFTPDDFAQRRREKGGFVERVLQGDKIFITGEEGDV